MSKASVELDDALGDGAGDTPEPPSRVVASGAIYTFANTLPRVLGFLLLPLYTTVLTPAEYGRLGILATIQGGAAIVMTAGLDSAITRGYFQREGDREAQSRFVASTWLFVSVASLLLSAIISVAFLLILDRSDSFRPDEGVQAVIGASFIVVATVVPLTFLRAEQSLRAYVWVAGTQTVAFAIGVVLGLAVFDLKIEGWLIATMAAYLLAAAVALRHVPWKWSGGFDWNGLKGALRIGLPLIPHALSLWSLQLIDRLILAALVTATVLGEYTLAGNLAIPAAIIFLSLNQALMPTYARRHAGIDDQLRRVISAQIAATCGIALAIAIVGPVIIDLLPAAYRAAIPIFPWLVLANALWGLYLIPMNAISLVLGKTTFVWVLAATAAAVNIALIFALVPSHGAVAAAIASVIGYAVLLIATAAYSKLQGLVYRLDLVRSAAMVAVTIAGYFVAAALSFESFLGVSLRMVCFAVVAVALVSLAGFTPGAIIAGARGAGRAR